MIACIDDLHGRQRDAVIVLEVLDRLDRGIAHHQHQRRHVEPGDALDLDGVPLVFDQIVMMPGMPSETKSTEPEISASFITSEERNGRPFGGDVAEARRLGVLLDQLQVLHHHVLHVGDAELLGDAHDVRLGARAVREASQAAMRRDGQSGAACNPPWSVSIGARTPVP